MEKMFFDTETNQCVILTERTLYCSYCKDELMGFFMVQRSYSKIMPGKENFYCNKCLKHNNKRDLDFFSICKIERSMKSTYKLISEHAPELRKGEIDLFNAVNITSEKTEDRTIYSNYTTFEGVKIGDSDFKDKKDKLLPYDIQIENQLKRIQNYRLITPKQLEDKK